MVVNSWQKWYPLLFFKLNEKRAHLVSLKPWLSKNLFPQLLLPVRGVEILAKTPVAVMGALISTLEENREVSFQSSHILSAT